jgi:hypothetical protein
MTATRRHFPEDNILQAVDTFIDARILGSANQFFRYVSEYNMKNTKQDAVPQKSTPSPKAT